MARDITRVEMLGVMESKNVHHKHKNSTLEIYVINKHLPDAVEAAVNKADETVYEDNVKVGVYKNYHLRIRKMIPKHKELWSGGLDNVNIMRNRIYLIPRSHHFKSTQYWPGQKTRKIDQFEIDKEISTGVIEHSVSEWATPVLFEPKEDGHLRFFFDYRKRNAMTAKGSYPLPRMHVRINSLGEAKVFTTLDA